LISCLYFNETVDRKLAIKLTTVKLTALKLFYITQFAYKLLCNEIPSVYFTINVKKENYYYYYFYYYYFIIIIINYYKGIAFKTE